MEYKSFQKKLARFKDWLDNIRLCQLLVLITFIHSQISEQSELIQAHRQLILKLLINIQTSWPQISKGKPREWICFDNYYPRQ